MLLELKYVNVIRKCIISSNKVQILNATVTLLYIIFSGYYYSCINVKEGLY